MAFIKGMSIGQKLKEMVMHVKNTQRNYSKTGDSNTEGQTENSSSYSCIGVNSSSSGVIKFVEPKCQTATYQKSYIIRCIRVWNLVAD